MGFLGVAAVAEFGGTFRDPRWALLIAAMAIAAAFGQRFIGAAYTGVLASLFLNFFSPGHYGRLLFDSVTSVQVMQLVGLALISSAVGHLRFSIHPQTRVHRSGPVSAQDLRSIAESVDTDRRTGATDYPGAGNRSLPRDGSLAAYSNERTRGHG